MGCRCVISRSTKKSLSRKIAVRSFDVLLLCHTDDYKHKALTIIRLTHWQLTLAHEFPRAAFDTPGSLSELTFLPVIGSHSVYIHGASNGSQMYFVISINTFFIEQSLYYFSSFFSFIYKSKTIWDIKR